MMARHVGTLVAVLAAALAAGPAVAANDVYVSITAAAQPQGAGAPMRGHGGSGLSPVLEFTLEAQSPRDAGSGQASGKRQWKQITIVKEWGAASPALGSGEIDCSAMLIAATLAGGQGVAARPVAPARAAECRYAITLPTASPQRVTLRISAPAIAAPWTFQAMPTAVELRAGQTLSAKLNAQALGEGGRFSVEWGAASPQLFTAKAPAGIPLAGGARH